MKRRLAERKPRRVRSMVYGRTTEETRTSWGHLPNRLRKLHLGPSQSQLDCMFGGIDRRRVATERWAAQGPRTPTIFNRLK
jgi:hypothetical protein